MNAVRFVCLVKQMRQLQREFFRLKPDDRPPSLIKRAKDAERDVDRALTELDVNQGRLFGGEGERQ